MEIAPGIHNVITAPEPVMGHTNTYLILGSGGAVLVDTFWGDREGEGQARIDYWRKLGSPPLRGIVLTHQHPPQWGNAMMVRDATGAPIICSTVEKDAVESRMGGKVDRAVEDGETMELGGVTLQFVHASGHTYGSLAVFIRETRALFTGDNVMGEGTSVVNPGEGEIAQFLQTMEKLKALNPAVIYPGQGPIVAHPQAKLDELIAHRMERERQVLDLLQAGPRTVDDMFAVVYADLDPRRGNMAKNQIRSHLTKLEQEGRVHADGDAYRLG